MLFDWGRQNGERFLTWEADVGKTMRVFPSHQTRSRYLPLQIFQTSAGLQRGYSLHQFCPVCQVLYMTFSFVIGYLGHNRPRRIVTVKWAHVFLILINYFTTVTDCTEFSCFQILTQISPGTRALVVTQDDTLRSINFRICTVRIFKLFCSHCPCTYLLRELGQCYLEVCRVLLTLENPVKLKRWCSTTI